MKKKVLILSPHADDEILGCGGFISKYSKILGALKSIPIRRTFFPDNPYVAAKFS